MWLARFVAQACGLSRFTGLRRSRKFSSQRQFVAQANGLSYRMRIAPVGPCG